MRRQTKKLALTMLLSVAMISANLQLVSAQEETLTEADQAAEDHSSEEAAPSQDAGEVKNDSEANQENTAPAESTPPVENTAPVESTPPAENTTPVDTETGKTEGAAGTETQAPVTDTNASGETTEGSGEGQEGNTEQDVQNPDGAAAADSTEGTQPEQSFVNKNGEEVKPSELVGVDYNTIAENYDGETNAVKQYMISDEVPAGTIMNSFVDENGNLVMVISQGAPASTVEEEKPEEEKTVLETVIEKVENGLESVVGSNTSAPPVDGSFTGWDDIPPTYEFNWDKPDAWIEGEHYTDPNSTDVRHEMKLYTDGENIYLRIIYAKEFSTGQLGNGNWYKFWLDEDEKKYAAYQVEWPSGSSLSNTNAAPGVYQVEVRHADGSCSYTMVDGAIAYYLVKDGNRNNELELKIPLSEFVKQNPNLDLSNYNMISYQSPNLMLNHMSVAGASTGAEPFAAAAFLLVPTSCMLIKKKNEKEGFGIA